MGNKKELENLSRERRGFLSGLLQKIIVMEENTNDEMKSGMKRISCYFGISSYNLAEAKGVKECYNDCLRLQEGY